MCLSGQPLRVQRSAASYRQGMRETSGGLLPLALPWPATKRQAAATPWKPQAPQHKLGHPRPKIASLPVPSYKRVRFVTFVKMQPLHPGSPSNPTNPGHSFWPSEMALSKGGKYQKMEFSKRVFKRKGSNTKSHEVIHLHNPG